MKKLIFIIIFAAICYYGWGYLSVKYEEINTAKQQITNSAMQHNQQTQADLDAAAAR